METLGSRIAFFRNAKRWTQSHLASELTIPQSTLSEIENDIISPKFDLLNNIADKLEIPVYNLLPQSGSVVYNNHPKDNVNANGIVNNYHSNDES